MRYYRITADYRPNNPNKPTYEFAVKDSVTKSQIKKYFSDTYSWLKVYNIEEISEDQYGKWVRWR